METSAPTALETLLRGMAEQQTAQGSAISGLQQGVQALQQQLAALQITPPSSSSSSAPIPGAISLPSTVKLPKLPFLEVSHASEIRPWLEQAAARLSAANINPDTREAVFFTVLFFLGCVASWFCCCCLRRVVLLCGG